MALPGLLRFNALTDSVEDLHLDGVKHAAVLLGMTNPDQCIKDQTLSNALNVTSVKRIFDCLGRRGIHCLFASTEAVFDGHKGDYTETDPAHPGLLYARQKLDVENYLAEKWPEAAIIRIAKVYGTQPGDKSLLDGWYRQAMHESQIRCAADFVSSVVHVEDVITAIKDIFQRRLFGLYHVGGPQGVSRFRIVETLLAAMRKRHQPAIATAVPVSIDDFPTAEKRPKNISMNSAKLAGATSFKPRNIEEGCNEYVARARALGRAGI